jgi:hypothetical protein
MSNIDEGQLRLVSEAYSINLAWLFDPYVAITTSIKGAVAYCLSRHFAASIFGGSQPPFSTAGPGEYSRRTM